MAPPIIGVCAAFETASWGYWTQEAAIVPATYLAKLHAAGAVPLGLIPDVQAASEPELLVDRIDGLLLIGGVDVSPASYGAPPDPLTEATEPRRDAFEIAIAQAALRRDLPVLGICRGMQILNVATGGTLHQHLTAAGFDEHRRSPGRLDHPTFHEVEVDCDSHAAGLAGSGVQTVNSHHHQGVDVLGADAVVTARSIPDLLPEAIEWPERRYALGVQWHPEALELQHALTDFVGATQHSRK